MTIFFLFSRANLHVFLVCKSKKATLYQIFLSEFEAYTETLNFTSSGIHRSKEETGDAITVTSIHFRFKHSTVPVITLSPRTRKTTEAAVTR